ncbi:4-diphosphocytidyl-2-C-methyl-D-erythritol kinase [Catalinimonas alkaloidigena]|uniref:4-(cytidine 5'-diphospho)-2-C-methyl-D-erythritol kinase n=1 Tax=Catalinimonas alkaloidigena TaxID=1075417 RepID=UPI0024049367|nr:4-(cytidine 5'-diphospho)-2-C-methyl-D-erythritol kinase [Catalinimonas alkaloidigena]MDF9799942.1 4-diphosphocytidyl-2-C-methyl-D-erythritol kinase [Catalinimonas alkaloidigena]
MIVFPNAKINLGLNILRKRPDGFHDITSCFVPVPYTDVLEIIESKKFEFSSSGLAIPGHEKDNLCIKAYHLLQKDFNLPPVRIHLHKVIPIGAGLGGGSADATFTLKCLNRMFDLFLDDFLLEEYASRLGSDCPFFVKNQPVMAYGTGNDFEEISLSLDDQYFVLVTPPIHVATVEAYAGITPYEPKHNLKEILEKNSITEWKGLIYNDFEKSIFSKYPAIGEIKEKLYEAHASYASMSGSGATVYGIFEQQTDITSLFSENYQIWHSQNKEEGFSS